MRSFAILLTVLCGSAQYQCNEFVDTTVNIDGDSSIEITGHPMPADGGDYDKPVPFDDEYNMPTDVKARLTGIGAEPDEAALEWQRTHQKREIKIHNEDEDPIYLYFDLHGTNKGGEFITRVKTGQYAVVEALDGDKYYLNDAFAQGMYISNTLATFVVEPEVWDYSYKSNMVNEKPWKSQERGGSSTEL